MPFLRIQSVSRTPRSRAEGRFFRPATGVDLATAVGLLDASVTLAYLIGINPIFWHAGTLLAKVMLAVFFRRRTKSVYWVPALFIATIAVILTVEAPHIPAPDDYIQVVGFLLQIALTLFLVEPGALPKYARAGAWVIAVMAAIHIVLCVLGVVGHYAGRYFYLGNSHPNLGGEIDAVGAFLAAYAVAKKRTLAIVVVLIADCLFLQARAALIVCFALFLVTALFDEQKRIGTRRAVNVLLVLLAGSVVAIVLIGTLSSIVSNALQLDDPYRGLQSGFSGRDAVWNFAIQLFEENPVFGTGFGYFESIDYVGPHNIILFALAENGLFGLLVLGVIFYSGYVFGRQSWFHALAFAAMLPVLMFNDRYLNLNPYPFMLYVVLMATTMVRTQKRAPRCGNSIWALRGARGPRAAPYRSRQ